MSQLAIDQLPDLCLRKIFRYFGLRDLARCRSVNHLFKFYADQAEVRELVVGEYSTNRHPNNWYLTDKPIESADRIRWKAFACLKTSQLRQQLKFLRITWFEANDSSLKLLNGLEQLIHLEIGTWSSFRKSTCSLPNLKVLCVRELSMSSYLLKTPSLEVMQYRNIEKFEFKYPETIKKLECNYTGAIVMAKFKNLEVFRCDVPASVSDPILPSVWEHLKELDFRLNWGRIERGSYETFRSSLTNFLRTRANSKGEELKIYFDDVLLLKASQLGDYDDLTNGNFLFKN